LNLMAKPALLTVDDDAEVLRAIERDLRSRYSKDYRVLRADSGQAALEMLKQLKTRNDAVALLLVDQRMPNMNGVTFLTEAMKLFPDSKRVMLTAYADTDAAIKAINEARIQHYLLKPWDPPDQNLYPVLDDLLEDWQADYRPAFQGLRVLGLRWSPRSYDVRDFLARNQIPYLWMDVETADRDAAVKELMASLGEAPKNFPVVSFLDGSWLSEPTNEEIAAKIGLRVKADTNYFDVAIVGAGPAGLAAGVYGASEGLSTVILEREAPGGQAGMSSRIENYLGFPSGLSGADLARRAVIQARRFGVEIISPSEAVGVRLEGPYKFVKLRDGSEISCRALLIATGVQWRKLDVPGVAELTGAGVYYGAATTEAVSCRDEDVFVVGGANSAGQAAMYLSKFARRVVMLVRGPSLAATMSQYLIDQIAKTENIHVEYNSQVVQACGSGRLEEIGILCSESNATSKVSANALFIFIGAMPNTSWLDGIVVRDDKGFILSGSDLIKDGKPPKGWTLERPPGLLETNVPGIFVVGDVRRGSVKRVASGVGEGSIAIQFVHQYLGSA
jgi:thioredoxin reductase (NADPH)